MLAKSNRLTKRGSFQYVYRNGKSVRTKTVTLKYVTGKAGVRLGISVSNKAGCAVVRNLIKRRMRAILRETTGCLAPCQAVFNFNASESKSAASYEALREDMLYALSKSGLLLSSPYEKEQETN